MTTAELAIKLGLHVETVRDYARRGIIKGKNYKGRKGYDFNLEKVERDLSLHFGNAAERDLAKRR
jgi:DNA-binding transcriptional MerR regulator